MEEGKHLFENCTVIHLDTYVWLLFKGSKVMYEHRASCCH